MKKNATCRACGKPMNGGVYRQPNKCPHCFELQDESFTAKGKAPLASAKKVVELGIAGMQAEASLESPTALELEDIELAELDSFAEADIEPAVSASASELQDGESNNVAAEAANDKKAGSKFSSFLGELKRRMAKPQVDKPQDEISKVDPDEAVVLTNAVAPEDELDYEDKVEPLFTGLTAKDDFVVEEIGLSAAAQIPQAMQIPEEVKRRVNEKPRYNARRIKPVQAVEKVPEQNSVSLNNTEERSMIGHLKSELESLQKAKLKLAAALEKERKAVEIAKAERELALQVKAEAEEAAQTEFSRAERLRLETQTAAVAAEHAKSELEATKAKMAELECEYETLVMLGDEMSEEPAPRKFAPASDPKSTEPKLASGEYDAVVLTSESGSDIDVQKRLGLVSAECLVDMDAIQGFIASSKDLSLVRQNRQAPNVVEESRKTVLDKLKQESFALGGNIVLNVKVDFTPIASGEQSLLMVVASGTAAAS